VAASRLLPVVVGWTAAGERPGQGPRGGLGGWFLSRVRGADVVVSGLTVLALVIASGLFAGSVVLPLAVAAGIGAGVAAAIGLIRIRGQIDGDLLGATVEVGLAAILGSLAITVSLAWPGR
jgi:cobalamin synthase